MRVDNLHSFPMGPKEYLTIMYTHLNIYHAYPPMIQLDTFIFKRIYKAELSS